MGPEISDGAGAVTIWHSVGPAKMQRDRRMRKERDERVDRANK